MTRHDTSPRRDARPSRAIALALAVALSLLLPATMAWSAPRDGQSEQGAPDDRTQEAATEVPAEATPEADGAEADGGSTLPFDPALVGLPGLPASLTTPADFDRALTLIDARLAELRAASAQAPGEMGTEPDGAAALADADAADAGQPAAVQDLPATPIEDSGEAGAGHGDAEPVDAGADEASAGDIDDAANGPADLDAAYPDPRIGLLESLRFTIERRAALGDQLETARRSTQQEQARLARIDSEGLDREPPISITVLDALKAELALARAKEGHSERRLASARTQLESRERAVRQAQRVRRDARDALGRSADADRARLELALEVARLQTLLAIQERAAAQTQIDVARAEDDLAETEQARLAAELRLVGEAAVLTEAQLAERLDLLTERADALGDETDMLRRRGHIAESRLYRLRRRAEQAATDADLRIMSEQTAALEAQVEAARVAVDYLQRAAANLGEMRRLWERRYALMGDVDSAGLAALFEANRTTLRDNQNSIAELETELAGIRTAQLNLAARLTEPGLDPAVQTALRQREAAVSEVERTARRLLKSQTELGALAQRVQEQLEPLVRERDLVVRWLQTQDRLRDWWEADLLVVEDQSIRVREGIIALIIFGGVVAGIGLVKLMLRRALSRRTPKTLEEQQGGMRLMLSAISRHTTQAFVLIVAFYVAMTASGLAGAKLQGWLWTLLVLALYLQIGLWVNAAVVDYFQRRRTRLQQQDPSAATGYGLLLFFLRVGIWIIVVVSALAYFRYPIAGLIGALGVGGIAVGLAVQNILGDVFSSMAIVLDKPVRVGDFIKAGETLGVVEHIGVKTTRIRSLSGEQIVLSNTDLLSSRVHNFKRFEERRIVFQIGVVYQTPRSDLERIPGMLRAAVEDQDQVRFDRAHFTEFGAFSLDFEVVYFVLSPDFALYRDIQQAINLGIHRRFEEAGIAFAYPTQELILRRGPALTD